VACPNRETIDFVIVEDLATLMWVANLASLELHVPQWRVGPKGDILEPDLLVFDLDPGEPATVVECCRVALLLKQILDDDKLASYPKTSGSKGLQLYVPIRPTPDDDTRAYAKSLAGRLTREAPALVLSDMTRALRPGKVLVDWSQNAAAKTTVAPYSLRARPAPTASTPVTWDEVEACRAPEDLRFEAGAVLERVGEQGDLLAALATLPTSKRGRLPRPATNGS
jgi:bifunctional non-homologous end joining protein LigD